MVSLPLLSITLYVRDAMAVASVTCLSTRRFSDVVTAQELSTHSNGVVKISCAHSSCGDENVSPCPNGCDSSKEHGHSRDNAQIAWDLIRREDLCPKESRESGLVRVGNGTARSTAVVRRARVRWCRTTGHFF